MIEQEIEISTADGTSNGVLYLPEGGQRRPGAIHLTDIGGIRPAQRDMARQLAAAGYTVLMPNVFYRTPGPVVKERMAELTAPLTPEAVERDARAYVDFLASHASVNSAVPIGVVGYCYSGGVAMRIAAAASFHGGRLYTDAPDSPHLLLPRIQARLYFGHAVNDRSMPEEAIQKLDSALRAWGGEYKSEVYEGAYHSWTVSDSPVYNPPGRTRLQRAIELIPENAVLDISLTTQSTEYSDRRLSRHTASPAR